METVTLLEVPTVVTMSVSEQVFQADESKTSSVTVTVKRGTAVKDETVEISASRTDGVSDAGLVSAVVNNGDGTYSATYTPPKVVGQVSLSATAKKSGVTSTSVLITTNAGPAANLVLVLAPEEISSLAQGSITARVTDAAGNGVGGLELRGTAAGGGSVSVSTAGGAFGSYSLTYTASKVEVVGTDEVTVSVLTTEISEKVTVKLTPVPPKEVRTLVISGFVYKKGGTVPVLSLIHI